MTDIVALEDLICDVCGSTRFLPIDFTSYAMPTTSAIASLHNYINHICAGCGVVTPYPQPDLERLAAHYDGSYRHSAYAIKVGDRFIEPPIQIPWSGVSFLRFKSFYDAVQRHKQKFSDLLPTADDTILDYGAYQGLFLHGAAQTWNCDGLAYDYSTEGIAFARGALGFKKSVVAKNIYADRFAEKVRFVVSIHTFEHLQYPTRFLQNLRSDILLENGWLYIEIPSVFGFPLSDPHHYYSYYDDNLRFLMEKCGFDVVEIWYSGHPYLPDQAWSNAQQSLHCLVRASGVAKSQPMAMTMSAHAVRDRIRRNYRRQSFKWATGEMGRGARRSLRALFALFGALVIDAVPVSVQKLLHTPAWVSGLLNVKSRLARLIGRSA